MSAASSNSLIPSFSPPAVAAADLDAELALRGYAVLTAQGVREWSGCSAEGLAVLVPGWDTLAPDHYLKDGGHYRRRRHSCFVVDGSRVTQVPHRAHWQPVEYNALHGGMQRWFEPMNPADTQAPDWQQLLRATAGAASALHGARPWFVEAHQFRIDTTEGIGRPTPEGAHRDGVDLVAVFLVQRHHVKGGETRVFEAAGPNGQRFTLHEPWSLLMLDDARMIHESTPIQPTGDNGHRDTLVLTCRAGGFQQ